MGRWSREELEAAFDQYQIAAHKGASTGDWKDWVACFTEDATYVECQDGDFWGQEAILKWISARLERAEPAEREKLTGELQTFMKSRAAVDRNGPGAAR